MKNLKFNLGVAALALSLAAPLAHADTIHTETVVKTKDRPNITEINMTAFDLNHDGMFSKAEVGTKLFYIFDLDGNEVIDNIEWDKKSMHTIMPMEKETFTFIDYDDDGAVEQSSYTYETFYQASGLIRFDKNEDGLSPAEFIATGYQELDDNDNNMIELNEWKEAYTFSPAPEAAEQEKYNNES